MLWIDLSHLLPWLIGAFIVLSLVAVVCEVIRQRSS